MATKTVRLETGLEIEVPAFVEVGDVIKVDTRTSPPSYVERIPKREARRVVEVTRG